MPFGFQTFDENGIVIIDTSVGLSYRPIAVRDDSYLHYKSIVTMNHIGLFRNEIEQGVRKICEGEYMFGIDIDACFQHDIFFEKPSDATLYYLTF